MATRIFRVNLSEGAPDFQPTATEPGLPMLDRLHANYAILHRWLGDLVAEPEWESETAVNFFIHEEKRGRLTDVVCRPARKADLEGPLKDDLELLKTRMGKVKPESTTEQTLYAITSRTFKNLTDDLELSDHDCFFFKYHEEKQPWKLVWCWGYQRADLQPSPAVICGNPECNQLYVHRPQTKALCPGCQKPTVRKKRGLPVSVPVLLALLLLLLLGAGAIFALLNPPRLVVTPGEWAGPPGAKVAFSVIDQRYYFFTSDVTQSVVPQSHDESVIEFDAHGGSARAKSLGRTNVTFLYKNLVASVPITVGLDHPPNSITIEPATVKLGVGSTALVQAMGHYDEGSPIDLTDLVEWQIDDESIAFVHDGRWEGAGAGQAVLTATYYDLKQEEPLEATADVQVADVAYQKLEIALDPISVAIGQGAEMQVDALDAAGERYSVVGSTWLTGSVSPPSNASIEDEFVIGRSPGATQLDSALRSPDKKTALDASFPFMVVGESLLAADVFSVEPKEKKMFVFQIAELDVVTGSDEPVVAESSDPEVVAVGDGNSLAARKIGTADVTFTQGDQQRVVRVNVVEATFAAIRIDPQLISMRVGDRRKIQVFGVTEDGEEVELFPGDVDWIKQPTAEHVAFDRDTLTLTALAPTGKPMPLMAQFRGTTWDEATIEVTGGSLGGLAGLDEQWGFYPPIPFYGRLLPMDPGFGATAMYDPNRGVMFENVVGGSILDGVLPADAVVTRIGGQSLIGLAPDVVAGHLAGLGPNAVIEYRDPAGTLHQLDLARMIGVGVQKVQLINVEPSNITGTQFDVTVNVQLREQAEYRIVNAAGEAMTDWSTHGPNETAGFQVSGLTRGEADDVYELFVERRQAETVRSYPISFALKSEDAGAAPLEP